MIRFSLQDRATVYFELGKLVQGGFSVPKAIGVMIDDSLPAGQKAFLSELLEQLNLGNSLATAFRHVQSVEIAEMEISLIDAAESSGQLGPGFDRLAEYFELRVKSLKSARSKLIYPVVLFHFGVLVTGFASSVFQPNWSAFHALVVPLLVAYSFVAIVCFGFLIWARRAEESAVADRLLSRVPVLGRLRRRGALARFCFVLQAYLLSGQRMTHGVSAAANASRSPEITHHVQSKLLPALQAGHPIGPHLSLALFPRAFVRGYQTAEETGNLPEELDRWTRVFFDDTRQSYQLLATAIGGIVFAAVAAFIAWAIIDFYLGYFRLIEGIMEGIK